MPAQGSSTATIVGSKRGVTALRGGKGALRDLVPDHGAEHDPAVRGLATLVGPLASRYGGIPDESLYHYYDEDGVAILEDVAGDMAEALAGAERDLLALVQGGTLPGGRVSPEGDDIADDPAALLEGSLEGALAQFAGARIGIVSEFVGMGRTGELEVTPNQP